MNNKRWAKRWTPVACPLAYPVALAVALCCCTQQAPRAPFGSFAYWQGRLDDPNQRGEALGELGRSRDPRALALLRTHLQQPGAQQCDAARGLGYFGDPAQVPLLAAQARPDAGADDAAQVRLNLALVAALRALDGNGNGHGNGDANVTDPNASADRHVALQTFVALLHSPALQVRADAVDAIEAVAPLHAPDTGAQAALLRISQHDPQMEIRRAAYRALAGIGASAAVPALVLALYNDAMYDTARLALVQLGRHSAPSLVQTLRRRNPGVEALRTQDKQPLPQGSIEARAGATLGAMRAPVGEAAVIEAFARLYDRYAADPQGSDPSLLGAIIELAYAVGDYGGRKGADALLPMVRAPQETLRITAAEALTNAGPQPGVVAALLTMATTGSADACDTFLETISRLGTSGDLATVRKQTGTVEVPAARRTQLLEDVADRLDAQAACQDDVACWRDKTHAPSDRVRERAAFELGWRHADAAVDDLLRLAEDVSADARFAAVLSLQRMPRAKVPLGVLQKIYEVQGSKLQYAAANQELKCLIARQKDF